MKSIGIFTHDLYPFKPWGQGRFVYDLVRFLRPASRRKVYVFSPSRGIEDPLHVPLFTGSHEGAGKNISWSLRLATALPELARRYDLGLVHFQGGPGGLFAVRRPPVPFVYTVHHTYHQQAGQIPGERWKKLLYLWERAGYGAADRLFCVSDSTRRVVLKAYGAAPRRCITLPNGVDGERFHSLEGTREPGSLFFLGRLEARKGIDFLVRAMPEVCRRRTDVRLYVGGEGRLRPRLEEFVRRSGLERVVHFLGTLPDAEINAWYNRVQAVVVPSVFEGFGLTVVEAMACGTAVIATEVDALRDVVVDGVDGLLVPYGDTAALAGAILRLLGDAPLRRRLAATGLNKVRRRHDWRRIAQRLAGEYEQILK